MTPPAPIYRERTYTNQDGLRLYYRDYGDDPSPRIPVLCLPGLTRNSKDFHGLALHLAAERRVLCADLRGRGRSAYDPDWRRYVPATYLNDLRHLLALTGLDRVVIVGTSLGGLLAMGAGAAFPTVLAGAVINDVGPEIQRKGFDRILAYLRAFRPLPDWEAAVDYLRRHFPPLSLETEEEWLDFARATFREGDDRRLHFDWDPHILGPLERSKGSLPDLWPIYRSLARVPVLIIRGGVSEVLTAGTFARMQEEHAGAQVLELPGIGHAPTLNEPAARRAIDEFLYRLEE